MNPINAIDILNIPIKLNSVLITCICFRPSSPEAEDEGVCRGLLGDEGLIVEILGVV